MKQKIRGKKVSIKHFVTKTSNAFGAALMLATPVLSLLPNSTVMAAGGATNDDGTTPGLTPLTVNTVVPMDQMPVAGQFNGQPIVHSQFTVDGHMAYCMSFQKATPPSGTVAAEKQAAGTWFAAIVNAGYPGKTPAELGLKDDNEAMYATELAIWHLNGAWEGGFNLDKITRTNNFSAGPGFTGKATSDEDQVRLVNAAKKIVSDAAKIEPKMHNFKQEAGAQPSVNLTKVSEQTVTNEGVAYQVAHYRVSGSNFSTITWSKDVPDGTTITQGGKTITKGSPVDTSEDIIVKSKLGENTQATPVGVSAEGIATKGMLDPNTMAMYVVNGYQNMFVLGTTNKPDRHKDPAFATGSFQVPALGKLKIHKIGENTADPDRNNLGGVLFNLIDEETGKVVQTGRTAKDGTLEFTNLVPKKYLLREMSTTPEHDFNFQNYEVTIQPGQEASIEVKNTEKPDKPLIRSYTYETDTDKTHGSRYVDAKGTDITDHVSLDNVDAGHNYLVRDTTYDRDTGEVIKGVDGKPAVSEKVVHAKDLDLNNGKDRGNAEVELTHSKVDLRNRQGHKIYTKVEVFRSKTSGKNAASDTESSYDLAHTGDKLAEESGAKDDVNQTLIVRKPNISTLALAYDKYKVLNPYSKSEATDHVHVTDLVPGHKYTLHLNLHTFDKDGNPIEYKDPKTGKTVTKDQTFEATDSAMDVPVKYDTFSTEGQNGKQLVTFTNITPDDDSSNHLGEHNDKDDKSETIHVTNPKLHTEALMDDTHTPNPNRKSALKDKVKVTDAAPDQPLEIGAIAADQDSNALEYNEDGTQYHLMGKVSFTPQNMHKGIENENYQAESYDVEVPLMKVKDETPNQKDSLKDPAVAKSLNKLNPVDSNWSGQNPVDAAKKQTGQSDAKWSKFQDTPYAIDTRDLKGKTFNLFEDLWEQPDNPMASEHDTNNKDQQIRVRNPKIVSEALLNDKKTSNPNSLSKLRDKVKFEDVEPGSYLEMNALAVDPATGKNLVLRHSDDDEQISNIRGKINFVPKTEKGEVTVPLKLTKVYKDDQKTIDDSKKVADSDKAATTDADTQKDEYNNSSTDRKYFRGNSVVQFAQKLHPDNSAARNRQLAVEDAEKDGVLANPDPRDTNAKADMNDHEFDIDTTALRGQKINLVEDLVTKPAGDESDKTVAASDADVNNEKQQVRVTDLHIKSLQTIDDKRLKAINNSNLDEKVPLIDTVEYQDAAPGEKITFQAVEMNKDQKRPVIVNGKYLAGQKTVTPKSSDGSAEVYFNPLTNAPAPYLTNVMLDKDGHIRNRAYLADIRAQRNTDENANKEANKGDRIEDAARNEHDNTQKNGVDDYKSKEKNSSTKNDDTVWQTFTDTRDSMYGTDDISSREDSSPYDIKIKSLTDMDRMESQNWTAFETALNPAGDIISEEKDYNNKDQTIKIKNDSSFTGGENSWGNGWNWGWNLNGNTNQNDSGHNGNGNGTGNGTGDGNGTGTGNGNGNGTGNGTGNGNGNGATVIINNGANGQGNGLGSGSGSGSGSSNSSQESNKNGNGNNSNNGSNNKANGSGNSKSDDKNGKSDDKSGNSGSSNGKSNDKSSNSDSSNDKSGNSNGKSGNSNAKSDTNDQTKIDKSELEDNIDKGDELKGSDEYKNADQAKKDALDKALENAKKVDQDENATQDEVDKANNDLEKAISDITGKPADSSDQNSSNDSGNGSGANQNSPEAVQKAANPSYAQTGGTEKVSHSGLLGFLEDVFNFNWLTSLFK